MLSGIPFKYVPPVQRSRPTLRLRHIPAIKLPIQQLIHLVRARAFISASLSCAVMMSGISVGKSDRLGAVAMEDSG
jgi:hypothetical protein